MVIYKLVQYLGDYYSKTLWLTPGLREVSAVGPACSHVSFGFYKRFGCWAAQNWDLLSPRPLDAYLPFFSRLALLTLITTAWPRSWLTTEQSNYCLTRFVLILCKICWKNIWYHTWPKSRLIILVWVIEKYS